MRERGEEPNHKATSKLEGELNFMKAHHSTDE